MKTALESAKLIFFDAVERVFAEMRSQGHRDGHRDGYRAGVEAAAKVCDDDRAFHLKCNQRTDASTCGVLAIKIRALAPAASTEEPK